MDQLKSFANLLQTLHFGLGTFSEDKTLMSSDLLEFTQDVALSHLLGKDQLFDESTRTSLLAFHEKFEAFFDVARPHYDHANYWLHLAQLPEWKSLQAAAEKAEISLRYYLFEAGIIPGIHYVLSKEEMNELYEQIREKERKADVE